MRQKAYEINGLTPPPLPLPAAPTVLPIQSPYHDFMAGINGCNILYNRAKAEMEIVLVAMGCGGFQRERC